jgi:hypothetical protein
VSAVTWWAQHPELQPDDIDGDTLLLNRRGTGSQMFDLPSLSGYTGLTMLMTCSQPVPYVIQVGTESNPAWTWTKGNTCDGHPGAHFTTKVPNPHQRLQDLYVMVPAGTQYFVTLYGVPRVITLH